MCFRGFTDYLDSIIHNILKKVILKPYIKTLIPYIKKGFLVFLYFRVDFYLNFYINQSSSSSLRYILYLILISKYWLNSKNTYCFLSNVFSSLILLYYRLIFAST